MSTRAAALVAVLLLLLARLRVLDSARSPVAMVAPSKLWHGRISRAEANAGYEHLQSIYRSDDDGGKKATAKAATGTGQPDAQFEAAKHLFATSARFKNAVNVLEDLVRVLADPDTSRTKIKQQSAQLKKYIIPLLSHAADTIDETATTLSPIASVRYVHNRNEVKKKNEVVDPNNKKIGPDMQLVAHHVREEKARLKMKEDLKGGRPITVTPPKKKSRRTSARAAATPSTAAAEDEGYPLPPPSGGREYTKDEVVAIVSKTVANSKARGAAVRAIVEHQSAHGVKGCSPRTVRRMMENHHKKKQPIVNKEWSAGGAPSKCTNEDLMDAAFMVLSGHTKMDLSCLTEADGLLSNLTNNFFHASRFPDRQGAYLYHDGNRTDFARSGKVTGRGFSVRHDEHEKGAKAKAAKSNFNHMYPSSESERSARRGKQGLFENLTMMIAAGYDPNSDAAKIVDKDWKEGGLLILSDKVKGQIEASMGEKLTRMEKYHNIVAYQFEFGYDLALCPGLNVSRSPGFESALGIFGGEED